MSHHSWHRTPGGKQEQHELRMKGTESENFRKGNAPTLPKPDAKLKGEQCLYYILLYYYWSQSVNTTSAAIRTTFQDIDMLAHHKDEYLYKNETQVHQKCLTIYRLSSLFRISYNFTKFYHQDKTSPPICLFTKVQFTGWTFQLCIRMDLAPWNTTRQV